MPKTRVIAGKYKNRALEIPASTKQNETVPVSSRLKAGLFSVLSPHINNETVFLDLFAGSGQIGIEALSRGASYATFVEISKTGVETIEKNLESLDIDGNYEIHQEKVVDFLNNFDQTQTHKSKFSIIFADPPFKQTSKEGYEELAYLAGYFLNPGGVLVIKHPPQIMLDSKSSNTLTLADQKKYGKNNLSFFVLPYKNK